MAIVICNRAGKDLYVNYVTRLLRNRDKPAGRGCLRGFPDTAPPSGLDCPRLWLRHRDDHSGPRRGGWGRSRPGQPERCTAGRGLVRTENLSWIHADGRSLPFHDAVFDAVLCHSMLEVLGDPAPVIAELRRVTKHGGVVGAAAVEYEGIILAGEPTAGPQRFYATGTTV